MPSDLMQLFHFRLPQYRCQKCLALFQFLPIDSTELFHGNTPLKCPICRVEYIPTDKYKRNQWGDYLAAGYRSIKLDDPYEHAKSLAHIAYNMRYFQTNQADGPGFGSWPPMKALFASLSEAQKFFNFTTYGIHPLIIGALKVTAQKISVSGIVSGARGEVISEATLSELADDGEDAFRMIVKHYGAESGYKGMPHQKLVVIDGLLAFKGAANLTLAGWRKAAQGRDVVEVVTDVDEVIGLNNRFFSPIWAELDDFGDSIRMDW